MRFASLGSGSRGNATLVQAGDTLLMVDCGFSLKQTESRMARLGVTPGQIDAILVTHEHTDHCKGVAALSKRYEVPALMTQGTWDSGRCEDAFDPCCITPGEPLALGDITVAAVAVPHDTREPCQFRFDAGGLSLGVLTDLGHITPAVEDHYCGCHGLLLECNHDWEMLQQGPYPPDVRERVGSDVGHLNNEQAAELLSCLDAERLQHLVIGHISMKNNCPQLVRQAIGRVFDREDCITWAGQDEGFDWLYLA